LRGLRVAFVLSAALLVLLALVTVASPLLLPMLRSETAALPEAGKIQLLARGEAWVLQYNLLNPTDVAGTYTFELTTVGEAGGSLPTVLHTTSALVDARKTYVFIYHLRPDQLQSDAVRFALRRSGEGAPVEDVTLHLPARGGGR
jgi:hypothetical protein